MLLLILPGPQETLAGSSGNGAGSGWLEIETWTGDIRVEWTDVIELETPLGSSRQEFRASARASVHLRVDGVNEYHPAASWQDDEVIAQGEWWEYAESETQLPGLSAPAHGFMKVVASQSAAATGRLTIDAAAGTYSVNFYPAYIAVTEARWVEAPPDAVESMRLLCEHGVLCREYESLVERQETESTRSLPGASAHDIPLPAAPGSGLTGSTDLPRGFRITWSLSP